ncbi:MAG TPA: EAL domain-containing protein [Actinomycetota bacterium]|jgi:EAL domain-containing protein (putative c-di-GMP-specific phosphodiesterase class I)/CheY-like chemotaxis protein
MGVQPIRVLIADDEAEIRAALAELIGAEEGVSIVGTAGNADEAAQLASSTVPDVALVDVKMPSGGGVRAAREILRLSPRTRVLALSAYEDRETVLAMLGAGAVGYLVKGTPPEDIVHAIARAARGQTSVSSEVMAGVVDELTSQLRRAELRAHQLEERRDRIRRILGGRDLTLVYQPIFRLASRDVVGYEALARFATQPERPPDVWFREATEVGLGLDLELLAIRKALEDLHRLPPNTYLSLNLSHRAAVSPRLLDAVGDAPLRRIMIEITEHEPVEDYDALANALAELRARGARIAIDDAGAGFASLRHTLLLSPDTIKLDISLTRGIDADRGKRALARALISFAEEMRMDIVAEGIETEREVETLLGLGAQLGQGFFLARPRRLADREAAAAARRPSGAHDRPTALSAAQVSRSGADSRQE